MQQTEEAAAVAEAQCDRAFRLIGQRRIVELELFQRIAQIRVLFAVRRIDTGKDHRLYLFIARQRLGCRIVRAGDGIAHAGVLNGFDGGGKISDLTGAQTLRARLQIERAQVAGLDNGKLRAGRHQTHLHARLDAALHQAHINDNAAVGIVLAVEDQRAQRSIDIALRRGNVRDNVLKHLLDVQSDLGGDLRSILGGQSDDVLDFLFDVCRVCARQVNLVDDRQDLQIVVECQIGIGKRLRLDALRRIHDEHRALARGERARNLIVEVYVTRRVNQVHLINLSVRCLIVHAHCTRLNRNAALALQLHIVQQLAFHLALRDRAAALQQAVCQRGLAVVDVRHDGKIANQ